MKDDLHAQPPLLTRFGGTVTSIAGQENLLLATSPAGGTARGLPQGQSWPVGIFNGLSIGL
ncbi:hypothetical protein [Paracoccus binzhouensis]|uniref:hypothetical protein n=1 Tax=Paracoccus binzhouensis TaxID=2796149 RepID=UPI0018EEF8D9|nr:hypothetical protein [Paracoccus binzhouensis]